MLLSGTVKHFQFWSHNSVFICDARRMFKNKMILGEPWGTIIQTIGPLHKTHAQP